MACGDFYEDGRPDPGERNLAMACHLLGFVGYLIPIGNVLGPLALWLYKREESAFVDDQGREALNFQISMTLYAIVVGLLCLVFVGFLLVPILVIAEVVLMILAAVKSSRGEAYRYPFCLRLVS